MSEAIPDMAPDDRERVGMGFGTLHNLHEGGLRPSESHSAGAMFFGQPTESTAGESQTQFSQVVPGLLPAASTAAHPVKHGLPFPSYIPESQGYSHTVSSPPPLPDASPSAFTGQTLLSQPSFEGILPVQQAPTTPATSDEPRVIIAKTASAGPVQGILLPGPIYHRRAGSNFPQKRYAAILDQPLAETDRGAPIVEPGTERIYGQVVQIARYSRVQVVYVVCVADALWDVSSRFDEEARLATLWYNKQRRAHPTYPQIDTGCDGLRMDYGMAGTEPVSSQIMDPATLIHLQPGIAYCNHNEPGFTPSSSASSDLPMKLSAVPASSVSDLLGRMAPTGGSDQKKKVQVQFVHYRGTGAGRGKRRSGTGLLGTDNDANDGAEQLCLGHPSINVAESDTAINVLLPDRKCPFHTCEYHKKGFVRKHDLVRHVITHYNGQLYCGFCPDGLAKSFGRPFLRVEPLKRHLAAVHHAAKFRKTPNTTEAYLKLRLKEYGPVRIGQCSICARQFCSASELYNHVESCVVQLLVQQANKVNGKLQQEEYLSTEDPRWEAGQQTAESEMAVPTGWGQGGSGQ